MVIKLLTVIDVLTKNYYPVIAGKMTSNETIFILAQQVSCPPDSPYLFFLANLKNCRLHYSSPLWKDPLLQLAHDYIEKNFNKIEVYSTITHDENSNFINVKRIIS